MNHAPNDNDAIIDAHRLREIVLYSLMHIYRLERAGKFPKRIRLGPHRVGWRLSEVRAWVQERIDAR